MLDEKSLRRPEFDEGASVPVTLFDGQAWYFPKPAMDLGPSVNGTVELVGIYTFGHDFEMNLDRIVAAAQDANTLELAKALFSVAIQMLRRNYTLADDDFIHLLRYRPGDDLNTAMWSAIVRVARGNVDDSPKQQPAGSVAPCS